MIIIGKSLSVAREREVPSSEFKVQSNKEKTAFFAAFFSVISVVSVAKRINRSMNGAGDAGS